MSRMTEIIDRTLYPDFGKNWDDGLFRRRVLDHLGDGKDRDILDLGAGAGILEYMNFRGLVRRVCGIDPDPRVLQYEFLDDARVGDSGTPFIFLHSAIRLFTHFGFEPFWVTSVADI